jgi:hypothetical protein
VNATLPSIETSRTPTVAVRKHLAPALALVLISTSWSGCAAFKRKVVVIPSSNIERFIPAGQTFTATNAGVFLSLDRYQRYRRAVADSILEETR